MIQQLEASEIALNQGQLALKQAILDWLANPSSDDKFRVLNSQAGTGKTTAIRYTIQDFLDSLEPGLEVVACAPTHQAVRVLIDATKGIFHQYSTIHHLLRLRLAKVKFSRQQQQRLDYLSERYDDLTESQKVEHKSLYLTRESAEQNKKELIASNKDLGLSQVRLIVIDESSMLNEFIVGQIIKAVTDDSVHPDLQVLFMGDREQLPPINEIDSLIFNFKHLPPLNEVMRNGGDILGYAHKVLERPINLQAAHFDYVNNQDVIKLPKSEVLKQAAGMFESGEDLMILAAQNKVVDEINLTVRTLIHGEDLTYKEGDRLLTRSAIERRSCLDMDYTTNCKWGKGSFCSDCDFKDTGIGTSQFLRIDSIESDFIVPFEGQQIRGFEAKVSSENTKESYATILRLVHPEDHQLWQDCIDEANKDVAAFYSRSKKRGTRGQSGDRAKAIWKKEGLKDWHSRKDGTPLEIRDFNKIRGSYFNRKNYLKEAFDPVSFAYASTIHRVQGCTIESVVIDLDSILQSLKYSKGNDRKAWDPYRLLYTAITRASKQLVLMG